MEGKNGAVIRKHIGYGPIPAKAAEAFQKFYMACLNPYLFVAVIKVGAATETEMKERKLAWKMHCMQRRLRKELFLAAWLCFARQSFCEDLVKASAIDPTKVTRTALQNASSISALMLTTDAMICEIPEKKGAAAPKPGHASNRAMRLPPHFARKLARGLTRPANQTSSIPPT